MMTFGNRWQYPSGANYVRAQIVTGQLTAYHVGDDGDLRRFLDSSYEAAKYTVLTAGAFSGTVNIDLPHYAAATIAFAATTPGTITDSANGLAIFKTGDTILVKGTSGNSQVMTVSTGNVAGTIRTTEATTLEAAGAYMTIYKRAALSNNAVLCADSPSGKMYARYTTGGPALLLGDASDGKLNWYVAAKCFALHPAAADLQMVAGGVGAATLRIVGGAGEIARYNTGTIIVCSGFANAVNNLPGYRIDAVAVNGADLDLTLWAGKQTAIAEAAAGSRDIKIICSSAFGYAAAANAASLGGFTDWVIPSVLELFCLVKMEGPYANHSGYPDSTAFPSWVENVWTSVALVYSPQAYKLYIWFEYGTLGYADITALGNVFSVCLVRGG